MAKKLSHVLPYDGSARAGGPRPAPPARPAPPDAVYRGPDEDYFYGTPDAAFARGSFPLAASSAVDVQGRSAAVEDGAAWAALPGGRRSPRQEAQRSNNERTR